MEWEARVNAQDGLQCGSGIREHMAVAFSGHQRAIYTRILREVEGQASDL